MLDAVGAWAYTQRMRSTRTVVAMVALLMTAHPAVAADTAGMVVRDAAGELVGTVVGRAVHAAATSGVAGEPMLWVARPIAGRSILLLVGDDALSDTKDLVPLFYESDDCSGSALLDAPPDADGNVAAVIFDTGVFWPTGRGASPYGLLDTEGNMWESCEDWWDPDYYKSSPQKDPTGPKTGWARVERGGSWDSRWVVLSASSRTFAHIGYREGDFGFRCASDPPPPR